MRTRVITWIVWIIVTVTVCFASFWYGRVSDPQRHYDLSALLEDRAILMTLRDGDTTNAIQRLESFLDMSVYSAMLARPQVHGRQRKLMDSILVKIADYRKEYPRPIEGTNAFSAKQMKVDTFLHTIYEEQPNTTLEPTPTAP